VTNVFTFTPGVVLVNRQLGRADPDVTLRVYSDLYSRAKHALTSRSAIEASSAAMALVHSYHAQLRTWIEKPRQVALPGFVRN